MANLDEFNLQLSGELDQQQSKKNINDDIATLERAIEHLKVQAEIDPNSVKNIAKQLSDILNQKIVVDNIQIDTAKATKTAQQLGQKIGDAVEKSVQQSLSIDDIIDKQVTDLMSKYSIAGKKGSKAFNEIRQAVVDYRKELIEANNTPIDPDDIFSIFGNSADISKVSSALANHIKVVDDTKGAYQGLAEYIKAVNNSGAKIHLPESIRQEYGDDFSSMRSQLGKAFTTGKGGDFESFVTELNGQLGNVIDLSQGAEAAFGDLVQKVNSAKGGNFLSGNELFNQGVLDRSEIEKNITSAINIIDEEEKKLAQTSTSTSNTVVQNEQKKQQAYQQTANAQKQVVESESLIKSDANVATFDHTKNAAREASEYFQQLLKDENAVISVSERFGQLNGLTSFTVNVKRATGEVESLRYALKPILDSDGNETGEFYFGNVGAELNNSGAIKQIKDIENAFSDYTAKLSQFKSTNSEILSGLTTPLSDFETKLAGLKNGTSTIDEVTNAYKSLNAEASNITKNFSRQLSPIDSAIRNLAKGEETISGLRAEFKGLNNAPKEINTELNKCARLLENVKKIEAQEGRTENWSQAYRQWSDSVDTLQAKLKTLRKEQSNVASTQIFNTSDLKNNNIAYMSKVYNTIEKQMVEINRLAKAKDWQVVDVSGVEQADGKIKKLTLTVRDAEGALKKLDMQREKLQGKGKAQYGLMQVGDVKVLETASQAMNQLAEKADKIQLSTDVTKLTTDYQKFGVVSQEVENNLKELKLAQEAVVNAKGTDRLATEIEKYDTALAKAKSSWKELSTTQVSLSQRTSQMTSMQEWMRKNSAATKLCGDRVKELISECQTCNKVRFDQIKNEFKQIQVEAGKAGKLGSGFLEGLVTQGKKFVQWIGVTGTVMRGIQISRDMIQNVKDLDDSLLELVKVSDLSASGLEKVTEQAYELGEKVGRTGRQVIDAVTEFKRAGYEMQDSLNMAEAALVMTNVAEGINDTADAAGTLISVLKGYNMAESDAMSIVDMMNSTSNQSPIGFDELAEGLERTAGTMAQSGTTIQETIGLITAGYAQLRNVEKVSTSLITLSARLRGVNEDGEEIDGLSAELQESFGKIGVAIEDADGNLRSIYAIAKDYAKVLPTLTSEQKQYYAELAAGCLMNNKDSSNVQKCA